MARTNHTTIPKNASDERTPEEVMMAALSAMEVARKVPVGMHELIYTGYSFAGKAGVEIHLTDPQTKLTYTNFNALQIMSSIGEGFEEQLNLHSANTLALLNEAKGMLLKVKAFDRTGSDGQIHRNCEYRPSRFEQPNAASTRESDF